MIWFGIVVVLVTELGLITPPIGMNVFVVKAVMPDLAACRASSPASHRSSARF